MEVSTALTPRTKEIDEMADGIIKIYGDIVLANADGYASAGETIKRVKIIRKDMLAERKSITVKIDEAKEGVMKMYRPLDEKLGKLEDIISNAMIAWDDAEQKRIEEENKNVEEAGPEAAMIPVAEKETPKVKGTTIRETWKAVVEDVSKLPAEWMIPDQKKLDKTAAATKGTVQIPGVKFVCTKKVTGARG